VAQRDGALPRAPHGPEESGDRRDRRAGHPLESDAAGRSGRIGARSICPIEARRLAAPGIRRRDRVRSGDAAVALDRVEEAHVCAAHRDLSRANRAARPEDSRCHHGRPGPCARACEAGRRRNRAGQVPRPAPRRAVRREGSPRHERHPDDVRRRAVPQSRAGRGLGRREEIERRRRGAGREAFARCAGAQRHLVRWPDDEPVGARGAPARAPPRRRRSSPFQSAAKPAARSSRQRCGAA
jgi:hypothetical protein